MKLKVCIAGATGWVGRPTSTRRNIYRRWQAIYYGGRMKRRVVWFLVVFHILILSCINQSETITAVLARVGDVDLGFKNQSLESINGVLKTQGEEMNSPEMNTKIFWW